MYVRVSKHYEYREMVHRFWSYLAHDKHLLSDLNDTDTTVYLADGSFVEAGGIGNGWIYCV